jgi:HEAT repeat protein
MTIRRWRAATALFALSGIVTLFAVVVSAAPAPDSKRLARAKDFIADEQWLRAIDELKAAASDPKEPNRDEALFWLAHSESQTEDLAAAIDTIARLERDFPKSRWVRPARSLRVEIAQRLKRDDVLWYTATPPPAPVAVPGGPTPPPPAPTPVPPVPPRPRTPVAPQPPAPASTSARGPRPPRMPPVASTPAPDAPAVLVTPPPGFPDNMAWIPAPFEPDTDLRIQALGSLLQMHAAQVIPLLKEIALDAKDPGEARRAVFVLAQSDRPEARTTVVEVARRGPEPVRIAAVRELGRFGGAEAGAALLQVYTTATPRVKREVVSSLAARGNRADAGALMKIARTESDTQVRNIAIITLGRAGLAEGAELRALYVQAPAESRRTVLVALCKARDEDGLIRIASTEHAPLLRQEARRQLRLLGTPKALKYLAENKE